MRSNFSRRDFLTRSAGVALAAGLWPGRVFADEAAGESGDFDFIAVNDLHFTDPKLCPPWFEKAFAAMRRSAPKAEFVLVSGDLSSEATAVEFGGLKELLPQLKLTVHVALGNHDVTRTGEHRLYDEHFPNTVNYALEHRGWQIFSVNSVQNRSFENTGVPEQTLQWLDSNLKKFNPKKPTLLSTHYPLGPGMISRPKNADALLERFADFNLHAVFNGHWHGFTQLAYRDAIVTTDRCCSRFRKNHDFSPAKGWFVCEARQGRIARRFVTAPSELL